MARIRTQVGHLYFRGESIEVYQVTDDKYDFLNYLEAYATNQGQLICLNGCIVDNGWNGGLFELDLVEVNKRLNKMGLATMFDNSYDLLCDSQDIASTLEYIGKKDLFNDIGHLFVKVEDGDYSEVWCHEKYLPLSSYTKDDYQQLV